MIKKYSSLNSNTTLGFNKKLHGTIASGIDSKTSKTTWFFAVLVLLGMTLVQKTAAANHNINVYSTTSYTYPTVILPTLLHQGQSGGGGGHGNGDWVMANGPNIRYHYHWITIQKSKIKLIY